MKVELASPNFKVGQILNKNLIIDIFVVAPNQPSALRAVLLASKMAELNPLIECKHEFRDSTWKYLHKKHLTDFVKEIVFPEYHLAGYKIGRPPATIVVDRITFNNMYDLAAEVLQLR